MAEEHVQGWHAHAQTLRELRDKNEADPEHKGISMTPGGERLIAWSERHDDRVAAAGKTKRKLTAAHKDSEQELRMLGVYVEAPPPTT